MEVSNLLVYNDCSFVFEDNYGSAFGAQRTGWTFVLEGSDLL